MMTLMTSTSAACDNAPVTSSVTVHDRGHGEWGVRAQQTAGGEIGFGEVIVRAARVSRTEPLHAGLAVTRAWLALGDAQLAAGDFDGAITCAKSGLAALGDDYAGPDVSDDTGLKLAAAADRLAQGHTGDAAAIMLRMLRIRAALYAEKHADTVVR